MRYHCILIFLLFITGLFGQIKVQDETTKVFNVTVGESGNGTIALHNESDISLNIRVSQVDYIYNANNDTFYLEPGKYERSNATWIKYLPSMTILPGQTVKYPFSFSVPQKAELIGSYWSVLFIEQDYYFSIDSFDDIVFNPRYAVQIIHNIVGTGVTSLSFIDTAFEFDNAILFLSNTGTKWIDANIKIDIYDSTAKIISSYTTTGNMIYPGLERQFGLRLVPLLPSEYYAVIVVDCGNNQIFGHQVNFKIR